MKRERWPATVTTEDDKKLRQIHLIIFLLRLRKNIFKIFERDDHLRVLQVIGHLSYVIVMNKQESTICEKKFQTPNFFLIFINFQKKPGLSLVEKSSSPKERIIATI